MAGPFWYVYCTSDGWATRFGGQDTTDPAPEHVTDDLGTWDLIATFDHYPTPDEVEQARVDTNHLLPRADTQAGQRRPQPGNTTYPPK